MSNNKPSVETSNKEFLMESSVNDARWLFGFVVFSGAAVFTAGIIASMFAA